MASDVIGEAEKSPLQASSEAGIARYRKLCEACSSLFANSFAHPLPRILWHGSGRPPRDPSLRDWCSRATDTLSIRQVAERFETTHRFSPPDLTATHRSCATSISTH